MNTLVAKYYLKEKNKYVIKETASVEEFQTFVLLLSILFGYLIKLDPLF